MPGAPFLAQAADGKLRPFSKQNIYVYHKWQLSMRECMLRSDAPSNTLPVLPLRVVSQGNFIIARCKSILCTRSFPMGDGESLVERFIDQTGNPGYTRCFCRKCGSAVPRLNRTKQYYVVPAGLLDADPIVKPERSVYWDDRAPWLVNIDAIPKLSEELDSTVREPARNNFPGTYPPEI